MNIVAYDYSGYGTFSLSSHLIQSSGWSRTEDDKPIQPSESYCYENIDAIYNYLTKDQKISPDQIVLYGRSLGTGITCDIASRKRVRAVILHAPLVILVIPFSEVLKMSLDVCCSCSLENTFYFAN